MKFCWDHTPPVECWLKICEFATPSASPSKVSISNPKQARTYILRQPLQLRRLWWRRHAVPELEVYHVIHIPRHTPSGTSTPSTARKCQHAAQLLERGVVCSERGLQGINLALCREAITSAVVTGNWNRTGRRDRKKGGCDLSRGCCGSTV
jgi:hypothetical protein